MLNIKNFAQDELKGIFKKEWLPLYCTKQIFSWVYKKRIENFDLMTDISKENRKILKEKFYLSKLKLLKKEVSQDGTQKFLFALDDSLKIESVLIPEEKRNTLCVSTQAGCKFGCAFCVSGKGGFKRDLKVSEIINQYLAIEDNIAPAKITNIVFMGIGEPLDNFANTYKSITILMDSSGAYFGKRRICVSTCGLAEQIYKLAELRLGIKLSVSLHSPYDDVRTRIMPVNKKYSIKELMKAVRYFARQEKYPVTIEYVLVKGLNAGIKDARALAQLLRRVNCKVNLIPYNFSSLEYAPPAQNDTNLFTEELKKHNIFFTLRKSRGQDIHAACGQLRAL